MQLYSRQNGLALLIFVIAVALISISIFFTNISIQQVQSEKVENTLEVLGIAKQAVLNYARTHADRAAANSHGILPQPETIFNGDDGNMSGNAGTKNTNMVDWLPWRSLDLPNLKDESGTCLLYAVSGTYKKGGTVQADMINEDSLGMFQIVDSAGTIVQGANIEDRVVALVIAPGSPIPGQVRNPTVATSSCGRDYGNQPAYLEGDGVTDNSTVSAVADTVDQFIHATESSDAALTPYNDKFLTITREEIWDSIVTRSDFIQDMENLTRSLAMCIAEYANLADNTSRRLPWPVITSLGATINYRNNNNYSDDAGATTGYSGRFPFEVDDSNNTINPVNLTDDDLLEIPGLCDNLDLGGGLFVNLEDDSTKYRKLWDNWKDHFFYILSRGYEPDNTGPDDCAGSGACIDVNGNEYAGAVIFSGSRLSGITRNDKSVVSDYLEDNKDIEFANEAINQTGDRSYNYTDPQTPAINDVMYCITDEPILADPLNVIECI